MSKLPNPEEFAKQSSQTVEAMNAQLRATNPSAATKKAPPKQKAPSPRKAPNKGTSDLKKVADDLRSQVTTLKQAEAKRKEYTPTLSIGEESLTLDYVGKVAGKSVVRQDPYAIAKDMSLLRPLLQPIISVANGALKGTDFTAPLRFKDEKFKAYCKASPLDKASYAYETLLANPDFVQKLSELNEVIQATFDKEDKQPRDIYAVSRGEDGQKSYHTKTMMDLLRERFPVTSEDQPTDDSLELG